MARTKQFDERQVLVSAMLTFWDKGYAATSMRDLEEAMGLNRTSIYNTFGNKRQIFDRVVGCYRESVLSALIGALDSTSDIREGVRRFLDAALEIHFADDSPGGCLVVLSIVESGQHDEHSRETLRQAISDLQKMLRSRLTRAKRNGQLARDFDTGAMAITIASTLAGMMVMGKAGLSRPALRKNIDMVVGMLA